MKIRLLVSLSGVLALLSQAHGSFELILAANISDNKIDRYDGDTGAYLGSFGSSSSTNWAVVADQPRNLVYMTVNNGSRVNKYNYNTGELVGTFTGTFAIDSWQAINSAGTEFYNPRGTNIEVINPNTGAVIRTITRAGMAFRSVVSIANQTIVAMGIESGSLVARSYNTATGATIDSEIITPATFATQSSMIGGQSAIATHYYEGNADTNIARIGYNASGVFTGFSTQTVQTLGNNLGAFGEGMAKSHVGVWMVGGSAAGSLANPVLRRYIGATTLDFEREYTLRTKSYTSITTVLAPEPGTMLALGGGLALILRRRRQK
jgi:hypothetical protein